MLKWARRRRPLAVLLLAGLLLLVGPGCHLLFAYGPGETGTSVSCTVEVWHCSQTAGQAKVAPPPPGARYRLVEGLKLNKDLVYNPYYDSAVVIQSVAKAVRGATLIQTSVSDWKVNTSNHLSLQMLSEVEALYVAYDARAVPPSWLAGLPSSDPNGYTRQAGAVVLSIKDPATGQYLKLHLWKRNGTPGTDPIVIPGNSYGNPGTGNISKPNFLNYVVLVMPKQVEDCTNGTRLPDHTFSGCGEGDQTQAALADCREKFPTLVCRNPNCTSPGGNTCALEQGLRSYSAGSLVEFYPDQRVLLGFTVAPSTADVTIGGSTTNSRVSGTLRFSYEGNLQRLAVNDLVLEAGTVATDAGRFEQTVLSLWTAADAECAGPPPPFAYRPCDDYQIPTGELRVSVASLLDGQPALWTGENTQPIAVHLNVATRTFDFSGSVLVTVDTDDGPVDLTAGLQLHGFIVDVMPEAIADQESRLTAECVEDRNDDPVLLSAAGSFDVYAPSPNALPRYEWWEDFGLVTQQSWGTTANVTIPRGSLGFGSHDITLLVGDATGLLDTDEVEVDVVDTEPPTFFSVPPDITTDIYPAGTESVQVDLGTYSARDACNPYVLVTNDAPEGSWFTGGTHTVTWTADDLRGNQTTLEQQVRVLILKGPFPWWMVGAAAGGVLVLGAVVWYVVKRGKAARRPGSEATPPPPPPAPPPPGPKPGSPPSGGPAPAWLVVAAAVMLVAVGSVTAWLLLSRDGGPTQVATTAPGQAASTTEVSTTGGTGTAATTTPTAATSSSEPGTTSGTPDSSVVDTSPTSPPDTSTSSPPETSTTSPPEPGSTVTFTTITLPGVALDPAAEPTGGYVKLISGFLTDPAPYNLIAGGPIDVAPSLSDRGCVGWTDTNPDLSFEWEGSGFLRFYYLPQGIDPVDTTLIVHDPAGGWYCGDDSFSTRNPTIDFNPSQRGFYEIWVGTYYAGSTTPGILYVTELEANHP